MKEKTKAFYKTVFRYWRKEKLKPFLIRTLVVLLIAAVGIFLFVLLMSFLVAHGVAAGYEIRI